ncbi:MAG: hypothetical protein WCS37_18385 [Chloroflexota bacterium]
MTGLIERGRKGARAEISHHERKATWGSISAGKEVGKGEPK